MLRLPLEFYLGEHSDLCYIWRPPSRQAGLNGQDEKAYILSFTGNSEKTSSESQSHWTEDHEAVLHGEKSAVHGL